jgi:MFS family permease
VAAQNLPFWGFLVILFFWGTCGAVTMSMSRTIVQQIAPEQYRARVLAVYSLASLGGMPIGAVGLGYCAGAIGAMDSLYIAAVGIWITIIISLLTRHKVLTELEMGRDF